MSAKTKTRKLKPRQMWANYWGWDYLAVRTTKKDCEASFTAECASRVAIPVVVVPLDDVEGLVNNAIAAYRKCYNESRHNAYQDCMAAAFRAIGIPVKKGGRK